MRVESAYDFPLPGFWSDRAVTEYVCDIGGSRYLLRQLDTYLLYRKADNNCLEHTFFVPYHNTQNAVYSQQVFAEQMKKGENGRAALYTCPEARDCTALLFFRQDGTGFFPDFDSANSYCAHEPKEVVPFEWKEIAREIASNLDILTAQPRHITALCHKVFTEQVWRRMKDPFVRHTDLPDVPLTWKCGSEAELTRLTTCVLHTQPGEWAMIQAQEGMWSDENDFLPVVYQAKMLKRPGGPSSVVSKRIQALCRLAFQHNTFVGHEWKYQRYVSRKRSKSYTAKPCELLCYIAPPSAHERAESLLILWDWLEDKVSEDERRAYLEMD